MTLDAAGAEIALEAAQELQAEYGPAVVAAVERRLAPAGSGTRAFEGTVSEAAAVASVVIGCVQVYLQMQDRASRKPDDILKRLEEDAPEPDQLSQEKRQGIIRRVLAKLTGKTSGNA